MRRTAPTLALLLLILTACASGGSGSSSGSSSRVLTQEDLATVANTELYEAIQRLRPRWLQAYRGLVAGVVINGNPAPDGFAVLRTIEVRSVTRVQFRDASDATMRYGTGFPGGAIEVTLQR